VDRKTVQCSGSAALYFVEEGRKRFYSYQAWTSVGSPKPTIIPCGALATIPDGPAMPDPSLPGNAQQNIFELQLYQTNLVMVVIVSVSIALKQGVLLTYDVFLTARDHACTQQTQDYFVINSSSSPS
jgi:hypothetical protein